MLFKFGEVDTQTSALHSVLNDMDNNIAAIDAAKAQLLVDFQGAGATGYEEVMAKLNRSLLEYKFTLTRTRAAIVQAATTGGEVYQTDQLVGSWFTGGRGTNFA